VGRSFEFVRSFTLNGISLGISNGVTVCDALAVGNG